MLEHVRLWLVALLVSGLPLASASVRAEQHLVRVTMADGRPLEPELYATMRELAARIGLTLTDRNTVEDAAWSSVRLSPSNDGGMDITVAGEGMAPSVHRHVGPSETPEIKRETIAHVVLGILEPRLDAERRRKAEAQPDAQPDRPAADSEPADEEDGRGQRGERVPHSVQPRTTVALGPLWLARDRIAAHAIASVGIVSDRVLEPAVALAFGVAALPEVRRPPVSARLWMGSARIRPSITPLRRPRFALELAAPVGVDVVFFRLTQAPPATRRSYDRARVDPVLGAALTGALRVAREVELTITVGADVDLTPLRWSFVQDERERRLLSLGRARPYAMFGFAWTHITKGRAP